jgi:hypothetical protein
MRSPCTATTTPACCAAARWPPWTACVGCCGRRGAATGGPRPPPPRSSPTWPPAGWVSTACQPAGATPGAHQAVGRLGGSKATPCPPSRQCPATAAAEGPPAAAQPRARDTERLSHGQETATASSRPARPATGSRSPAADSRHGRPGSAPSSTTSVQSPAGPAARTSNPRTPATSLTCGFSAGAPCGIEPLTPSLPWNQLREAIKRRARLWTWGRKGWSSASRVSGSCENVVLV